MRHLYRSVLLACVTVVGCSAIDKEPTGVGVENLAEASPFRYRGATLAGAEFAVDTFGGGALPGVFGKDYIYPTSRFSPGYETPKRLMSLGLSTFRLPFRWERLQPARGLPFDADEWARLRATVSDLEALGATVILDVHNFARYGRELVGSTAVSNADFADLWSRLATLFRDDSQVLFGLMNEPHDMPTEQWVSAANAAIGAVRQAGARQLILVPGNAWSAGNTWNQNFYGTANAEAMLKIVDPGSNFAYEVHQYLDDDSSGSHTSCTSATAGSSRLAGFTQWLRANGKRGFLGEFSGGESDVCLRAIDDELAHLEGNADVWLGWTYWAAGPWWGSSPSLEGDPPQLALLTKSAHGNTQPAAATAWQFTVSPSVNSNWVQVSVAPPAGAVAVKVEAILNQKEWHTLEHATWGDWTGAFSVPPAAQVVFRAWDTSGSPHDSTTTAWPSR
jgi:endoglucanase